MIGRAAPASIRSFRSFRSLFSFCSFSLFLFSGCTGTIPPKNAVQIPGKSAVLASSSIEIEGGPARTGTLTLGLMGVEENEGLFYRLILPAGEIEFFQIQPGAYRLSAPLSFFGFSSNRMKFTANGKTYWAPWPQSISDNGLIFIKPGQVVSLGILKAQLWTAPAKITLAIDDSVTARREQLQSVIKDMDPAQAGDLREMSISWMDSVQEALTALLSDKSYGSKPAAKLTP